MYWEQLRQRLDILPFKTLLAVWFGGTSEHIGTPVLGHLQDAIEDAFRDHNLHDAYKHLKTLGVDKEVPVTTLKDLGGNVLTAPEVVHAAWKEFFEVLLNCRRDIPEGVYEDLPVCPADSDFMVEMAPSRLEVSWGTPRHL